MSENKTRIYPEIDTKLYERLKKVAKIEKRTASRQIECFIEDCLENYLAQKEAKHA